MFANIKTRLLRLDELFIYSIKVFAKNFKYIFIMTLLTVAPMYIIKNIFFDFGIFNVAISKFILNTASALEMNIIENAYILMGGLFATFSFIILASIVYIVKQEIENKEISFSGIFDASILKWGRHFYTNVLFITFISLLVGFGYTGIFFAIYFYTSFVFYTFLIALTKVSGISSFSISKKIIQGYFLKTLLLLILILIYQFSFIFLQSIISQFIEINIVIGFISELILNLINCVTNIMLAIWFLNLVYFKKINIILD